MLQNSAEYIHCASLGSVFDVWAGPQEQLDKYYHGVYVNIAYFKGLEGVGIKGVFLLREGREVDRQVSRQLGVIYVVVSVVGVRSGSFILRLDPGKVVNGTEVHYRLLDGIHT